MQAAARPRLQTATAQLEQQREKESRAGHPERMAQRDGTAVDVDPVAIELQLLLDREILRREGLVDFDEIDVGQR